MSWQSNLLGIGLVEVALGAGLHPVRLVPCTCMQHIGAFQLYDFHCMIFIVKSQAKDRQGVDRFLLENATYWHLSVYGIQF